MLFVLSFSFHNKCKKGPGGYFKTKNIKSSQRQQLKTSKGFINTGLTMTYKQWVLNKVKESGVQDLA